MKSIALRIMNFDALDKLEAEIEKLQDTHESSI